MHRRTRRILLWTAALATLVLVPMALWVQLSNAFVIDSSMHGDFNATARHAMAEGTFIRHVEIAPDTVRMPWGNLPAGRGWIHEDSHVAFRWVVRRRLVREGTYRLCFTLPGEDPGREMGSDVPAWLVDVETGLRYHGWTRISDPFWRYCRPVTKPFPSRVTVAMVVEDSLRARMQRFVGAVHPPAPAATRQLAHARVQAGGRAMLLAHTEWNGLAMLWISEHEVGAGERWRVIRVMDYPERPINYHLKYGICRIPGGNAAGTLVLQGGLGEPTINSAWQVEAAGELAPVPLGGLACKTTRPF